MHINLLESIPINVRGEFDDEYARIIKLNGTKSYYLWPWFQRLLFKERNEVQQGCLQYLAHHHCLMSALRFGLSLCPIAGQYRLNVTSLQASQHYLSMSIGIIMEMRSQQDMSFITDSEVYRDSCHMLVLLNHKLGIDDQINSKVIWEFDFEFIKQRYGA